MSLTGWRPATALTRGKLLGDGEGLDQIVVGARLQTLHPAFDAAQGREQQDGFLGPGGADRAKDRHAVPTAGRGVAGMAGLGEGALEVGPGLPTISHHKQTHGRTGP